MQFRNRGLAALSLAVLLGVMSGCSSANKNLMGINVNTGAPAEIAANPLNRATSMAIMTATFSEAMDARTISMTSFAVSGPDGTSVLGGVAYDASAGIVRFSPANALAPGKAHSAPASLLGETEARPD